MHSMDLLLDSYVFQKDDPSHRFIDICKKITKAHNKSSKSHFSIHFFNAHPFFQNLTIVSFFSS